MPRPTSFPEPPPRPLSTAGPVDSEAQADASAQLEAAVATAEAEPEPQTSAGPAIIVPKRDFSVESPEDFDATALLRTKRKTIEDEKSDRRAADDRQWQYYIRCYRGCHGVYCRSNPFGRMLTPQDWFSDYKRLDEPWGEDILCQECYKTDPKTREMGPGGEEMPLVLNYLKAPRRTVFVTVTPDYIYRFSRDPEIYAREGAHRAIRSRAQSANVGLHPSVTLQEAVTR